MVTLVKSGRTIHGQVVLVSFELRTLSQHEAKGGTHVLTRGLWTPQIERTRRSKSPLMVARSGGVTDTLDGGVIRSGRRHDCDDSKRNEKAGGWRCRRR
jgi:hypothetical protein